MVLQRPNSLVSPMRSQWCHILTGWKEWEVTEGYRISGKFRQSNSASMELLWNEGLHPCIYRNFDQYVLSHGFLWPKVLFHCITCNFTIYFMWPMVFFYGISIFPLLFLDVFPFFFLFFVFWGIFSVFNGKISIFLQMW